MAVKLSSRRRWNRAREYIERRYGIKVNFSSRHENYYTAWKYTTKEDCEALQSDNHPDLENAVEPRTGHASNAHQINRQAEGKTAGGKRKLKSLSVYDVSQLAFEKGIKTRLELLVLANEQREGKTDLAEFIANRGAKAVEENLIVGWEFENTTENLNCSKLSRIQILYKELEHNCVDGCEGKWIRMALQVLNRNGIAHNEFANAVCVLLEEGRGKYRNILLRGPANCGKTFLLNPLNQVFKTLTNPATTTFAWVGAETAEVIFLNDFRWSTQIIP